ncbi:MAG: SURF1 family protein [Betaproteobacteria bacterium]|nr:SURF1 family protein [Betaproteobacteria bacterium]
MAEPVSLGARQFWPALAAVLVIALTVSLGRWQLERASMKEAQAENFARQSRLSPIHISAALINAEQINYRQVSARGEWLPDDLVFLDNQVRQGQVGYLVYMPLRLEGGEVCILVNRGWVNAGFDRARLPVIRTPRGSVEVSGVALIPSMHFKELSATYREGRIWENITIERFAKWSGLKLQPTVIWQADDAADGLARAQITPDSGAERNLGYAFQWFALAVLTAFLWAYYFFKKKGSVDEE